MKIYILNVLKNKKMLLRFWEIILEAKIGDDPYKKVSVRVLLKHTFTYNFIMEWLHETLPRIFPEQIFEVKMQSTLFFPVLPFASPVNIRKPLVFWCFQGDDEGTLAVSHQKT